MTSVSHPIEQQAQYVKPRIYGVRCDSSVLRSGVVTTVSRVHEGTMIGVGGTECGECDHHTDDDDRETDNARQLHCKT